MQPFELEIRKLLVISTAHLPQALFIEPGDCNTVVYPIEYGMLLWVPDDPRESSRTQEEPVHASVLKVQLFARQRGCDYVMFDRDADRVVGLRSWEW